MKCRKLVPITLMVLGLFADGYCHARGGGGVGGRGGGAGMGGARGGGGGFNSGARPSGGFNSGGFGGSGFNGGGFSSGGFSGGARPNSGFNSGGFSGGARPNSGNFGGGGLDRGNFGGGNFGAGNFGAGAGRGPFGDGAYGNRVTSGQLGSFLGMSSDEGMHSLGSSGLGSNMDVNHGSVEGPRGGTATGTTVTGPRGNTVGRGVAEGPNGGTVAGRGVAGADGGRAGQAIGVGPNGGVAAGSAVRGPNGGFAARGAAVGPNGGYAAGFARVSPSGRYVAGAAVRGNFNHWGVYGRGWYGLHPGAWALAGWADAYYWQAATMASLWPWMGWSSAQPIYYDYGNNVTYVDDSVYLNGESMGTSGEFYDQAASLATTGSQAQVTNVDADWLPLGVFALAKNDATKSDVTMQLAVNKQGILRGNYTDSATDKTQVIQGSVDKKTQRAAFTVGDNKENVIETGVYNLTKDEAPALIHFGKDRTEQWLLVRLNKDADQQ